VLAYVPATRLMIGSDLPENTGVEIGKILTLPVDDAVKREILSGTACRLFCRS
jgi:predicted TIM-barrel fold metal-dependent hydrolase